MGETRQSVSPARVFARPTADKIWLGPSQQTALSQLSRGARLRLLVGPTSSGKSTLLKHLAVRLAEEAAVVLSCSGPKDQAGALLTSLLLAADLGPWELSEVEQRNLLTVFVQERCSQKRRVVVVIDNAHTLKAPAWEELSRLLAFRVEQRPALEIVLAGPPSLANELGSISAGLKGAEFYVHPMNAPSQTDLVTYVEWRLGRFDMKNVITPVAAQMIARLSGGRYAGVDVLCQMSLLLLRQLDLERVDARLARRAVATLVARQGAKLEPTADESVEPFDAPPPGYLLVSRGGKVLTRATLGQRTLIGRSEHNDVCLVSPYLSRHHAVIVGTPEGYYVIDLNSVNGVSLNGQLVERAVLCDQDMLAIGPFRLKVQIPEWLAHGNPFPDSESLADTALMSPHEEPATTIRRVK